MSERAAQTMDEVSMEYRQDVPENELPSQPSDPQRNPGITQDLATLEARQTAPVDDEPVEIDLAIGVGEDPGWQRAVRARRWREREQRSVHHGT